MKRRVQRIYPPYAFALLFFFATRALKIFLQHSNQLAQYSVTEFIQNLTLTQWLTLLAHPSSYAPANHTLMVAGFWSLNYEEQFYLLVGLMLCVSSKWRRVQMHYLILGLTTIGFLWVALFGRLCYGLFIDYWALFALGVLVYLRLTKFGGRARRVVDLFLGALVVLSAVVTMLAPCDIRAQLLSGRGRAVFAELLTGGVFSLVLIAARSHNDWIHRSWLGRCLRFLGLISYSLYLVHQFNLVFVRAVVGFVLPGGRLPVLQDLMAIVLHVGIATVFWCFCERPFLNKQLPAAQVQVPKAPRPVSGVVRL
jgi:peptidoglycan/LPS O-acetylase OafA/YrhL